MISENKLKHILGVARRCKELAEEYGLSESEQNACFMMGFLHDIGYEKVENLNSADEHPDLSCELIDDLTENIGDIKGAIKNHGVKYNNLGIYDKILNIADLQVSSKGERVSCEERLEDIANRYGHDTIQYKHAVKQYEVVKEFIKNR